MIMKPPALMSWPHTVSIRPPDVTVFDESGAAISQEAEPFTWPAYVDPAGGGERGVIPNGAAENTYSFSVFMPYTDRITEAAVLEYEGRPLHIAYIQDQGNAKSVMVAYCTEVRR